MGLAILFIALFGILGMTWLFPIIGRFFWKPEIQVEATSKINFKHNIAILIPAKNEEETLPGTLWSISDAIEHVKLRNPDLEFSILVGADSCSDKTADIARDFGAKVVELKRSSGKWQTLVSLIQHSKKAEWVALVDSGTIWPEEFLSSVQYYFQDKNSVAIAPTYKNSKGGIVEKILWSFERHLKALESSAGGPISVHGATVLYRKDDLELALAHLCSKDWLNDDVVVPLTLRALFPTKSIRYISRVAVTDYGAVNNDEFKRRKRMAVGNLEWITELLPNVWNLNKTAAIIAMRRVFRVSWAYWFSLLAIATIALGITVTTKSAILPLLAAVVLSVFLILTFGLPIRKLFDAAKASFAFPYYYWTRKNRRGVAW